MTQDDGSDKVTGVSRVGTAAAWITALGCLPYLFLKVAWTFDVAVGLDDRSELESSGWVASNAVMALVQLCAVGLAFALVRPWGRRLPTWLLLLPVWWGIGLLFQVVVGASLMALSSAGARGSDVETGGIQPWVYVMVYTTFALQGIGLAIAFTCHVRARWGDLLAARTVDVLVRQRASARSWPQRHLASMMEVVAALAVAVGIVCAYWAAGGSTGLPGGRPDSFAMQASRATAAITAAAGLLGLAGRWGRRTRFSLPAALTWVGSGALVAFDGLLLTMNRLSAWAGSALREDEWAWLDAVLVAKVAIGVAAAALGAVVVKAAATDDRSPSEVSRKHLTTRP